jgi:hypothetical protein
VNSTYSQLTPGQHSSDGGLKVADKKFTGKKLAGAKELTVAA